MVQTVTPIAAKARPCNGVAIRHDICWLSFSTSPLFNTGHAQKQRAALYPTILWAQVSGDRPAKALVRESVAVCQNRTLNLKGGEQPSNPTADSKALRGLPRSIIRHIRFQDSTTQKPSLNQSDTNTTWKHSSETQEKTSHVVDNFSKLHQGLNLLRHGNGRVCG